MYKRRRNGSLSAGTSRRPLRSLLATTSTDRSSVHLRWTQLDIAAAQPAQLAPVVFRLLDASFFHGHGLGKFRALYLQFVLQRRQSRFQLRMFERQLAAAQPGL